MIIWIDAQFSPAIATWITENFDVQAIAVRELGLRDATDRQIFLEARQEGAVVMTKDSDFPRMLDESGAPPIKLGSFVPRLSSGLLRRGGLTPCLKTAALPALKVGNTSNKRLREILSSTLASAIALLESGETLVEINGQ